MKFVEKMPSPQEIRKKSIVILRNKRGVELETKNIKDEIVFMEVTKQVLENMLNLCQEIYLPVLQNQ